MLYTNQIDGNVPAFVASTRLTEIRDFSDVWTVTTVTPDDLARMHRAFNQFKYAGASAVTALLSDAWEEDGSFHSTTEYVCVRDIVNHFGESMRGARFTINHSGRCGDCSSQILNAARFGLLEDSEFYADLFEGCTETFKGNVSAETSFHLLLQETDEGSSFSVSYNEDEDEFWVETYIKFHLNGACLSSIARAVHAHLLPAKRDELYAELANKGFNTLYGDIACECPRTRDLRYGAIDMEKIILEFLAENAKMATARALYGYTLSEFYSGSDEEIKNNLLTDK